MARKSRKSIPETVSSAAVQEEIKRPFRAGLYARISMETEETIERGRVNLFRCERPANKSQVEISDF